MWTAKLALSTLSVADGKTVHEITVYRMVLKKEKMHQRLVIMKAKLNQ